MNNNRLEKGTVEKSDFSKLSVGVDIEDLFKNLIKNGYINKNGIIQEEFYKLTDYSNMVLDSTYESQKERIYTILQQPQKIEYGEYKEWLKKERQTTIDERTEKYYETVTTKIKRGLEKSNFWIKLNKNLRIFNAEYFMKNKGYPLFIGGEIKPELLIKSFDSLFLKTYRKNILYNKNWPFEPENGWILPDNWYSRINDIIRTEYVVKYLDGVEFLSEKIELCSKEEFGLSCNVSFEAKEDGYYAAHLYIEEEFEIPNPTWDTKKIIVLIEIQITTQLQEVIRKLLHRYYEERRKQVKKEKDIKWQWNYKSDEFATNYLGHILHYLEGMIVKIKEGQKEKIT